MIVAAGCGGSGKTLHLVADNAAVKTVDLGAHGKSPAPKLTFANACSWPALDAGAEYATGRWRALFCVRVRIGRYATSKDGMTWSESKVLAGPPQEGYAYIARGFWPRDGELLGMAAEEAPARSRTL